MGRNKVQTILQEGKIKALIDLVSMIPQGYELPDLEAVFEKILKLELTKQAENDEAEDMTWYFSQHALGTALYACLENLPDSFRNYVLEANQTQTDGASSFENAARRYLELRATLAKLRLLARLYKLQSQVREGKATPHEKLESQILIRHLRLCGIELNERGEIQPFKDSFTDAVEGIEAGRIHECEDCHKLFYAVPSNKLCCSKECSNRNNVRRHRERARAQYNQDPIGHVKKQASREWRKTSKAKKPTKKGR